MATKSLAAHGKLILMLDSRLADQSTIACEQAPQWVIGRRGNRHPDRGAYS